MALTDTKARSMKPADKALADGTVTGLTLIPGDRNGCGKWNLRFVSPASGKRRDMGLGTYPAIGLDDARTKARSARALIVAGLDPIDDRKAHKSSRRRDGDPTTFKDAAEALHAEWKLDKHNKKHIDQWINTLRT